MTTKGADMRRSKGTARKGDDGFTLIELMVVVLIIGILVAIAVPTYLRSQHAARSRAVMNNLRASLSAAKTYFAESTSYSGATVATLKLHEPSLLWTGAASTGPQEIKFAVNAANESVLGLAARASNGACYFLVDDLTPGIGALTYAAAEGSSATCDISIAPDGTPTFTPAATASGTSAATGWPT